MSTKTKRFGIIEILKEIFGENKDTYIYNETETRARLPKELQDTLSSIGAEEEKMEKGFNIASGRKTTTRINPETEKAMRAMHSKVTKKEQKTADREERD